MNDALNPSGKIMIRGMSTTNKSTNMSNAIVLSILFLLNFALMGQYMLFAQHIPILEYTTSSYGQAQLEINSTVDNYYILKIRHDPSTEFGSPTSIALGESGTTVLTEPLGNYPLDHYQVIEHSISTPFDTDGDGFDDITEYYSAPLLSPINAADSISRNDGLVLIDSFTTFEELSIIREHIQWSEFLDGKRFVKFIIVDFNTPNPKTYFINSNIHDLHADFANEIGIDHIGNQVQKGQIIYHPTVVSNNGTLGAFAFNYSNGNGRDFGVVQKSYELLGKNMPFLENNLSYFITANNEDEYDRDSVLFQNSRVPILFETGVYADIDYWGLNQAEGFGFFRQMSLGEIPSSRDIVLYESLPNSLPRVGGTITSIIQTPLSHVNLRAIHNRVPNAFIRDPLSIDSIANLLDHYIYFKAEQDNYIIREATLEEVNTWFEGIRPNNEQAPPLNLNYTSILPLDEINFMMYDAFGAKCANLSTMRTFDFPDKTIPDGFGIPFYFYQEFMRYNHFFDDIEIIINTPGFESDRTLRNDMLKAFRKKITEANMPSWMMNELTEMHQSFPHGTSVRCRSSSNNEDLPGFSGAGLYTSKTQHPYEGHIAKSIKQVYASLWNLRAFEEREFYRVDHFTTSMGILCHPNYSNEKANGVGVSIDPIYNVSNTFYLNSQIGEELITNPDANAIPEEILLDRIPMRDDGYVVVQYSNLLSNNTIIMEERHLNEMRNYLSIIHDEFALKYNAVGNNSFAMDIEYKITSDNQLIIKQARPWAAYTPNNDSIVFDSDNISLIVFPNPADEYINIHCDGCNLTQLNITDIMGKQIQTKVFSNTNSSTAQITTKDLPSGIYILNTLVENNSTHYARKFIKK